MRCTRSALPVAALAVATLALGACTNASQEGSASAGFDVAGIAKDDAVAALVPADVAQDGKLTVGSELSYAPAEFTDTDGTTPIGFDIDIATAVARLMGLEVDIQSSTFDAIIPGVGTRYEVGVSAFTITPERLATVSMVSYFNAGSQLAVPAGNPDGVDPENLCGLTVGVQTGTVQQDELETLSAGCGADAITVLPYDDQATVTSNLVGGKLQAMYADSPITAYAVARSEGRLETLGEIRDAAPYGVVLPRDDAALAEAVRAALQKLMDDGVLRQIGEAWGNGEGPLSTAEINPQL